MDKQLLNKYLKIIRFICYKSTENLSHLKEKDDNIKYVHDLIEIGYLISDEMSDGHLIEKEFFDKITKDFDDEWSSKGFGTFFKD